jgi:two-component system, chemotaxis family, sensor histidine kinase and response regulator PixL
MHALDPEIRDQAYQFFTQESLEFLQILEEGLITLRQDHSVPKVHELMRAAHSIKGGAASVGLTAIQYLAHQLEDVLRSLYRQDIEIDLNLEELLLKAYDCLRSPLMQQVHAGHHDEETAILQAEPIFAQLIDKLGQVDDDVLPSASELGVDIIQVIFSGDVSDGLTRLQRVLAHPDAEEVAGEICAQADVFVGVGELTNLPGFVAIAQATIRAVRSHPKQAEMIGRLALADFQMAQAAVLGGDRVQGGQPSAELMEWVEERQAISQTERVHCSELDTFFEEIGDDDPLAGLEEMIDSPAPVAEPEPRLTFSISDIPVSTIQVEAIELHSEQDSFKDLETLFSDVPAASEKPQPAARYIDQYIQGNQSLVTRLANRLQDANPQNAPSVSNTIRVDLERLERLNNLVGELVTQENGTSLYNQQLQGMLKSVLKRLSHFEQITHNLQDLIDRGQNDRARLQESLVSEPPQFDALQMDAYSNVHLLMQETVEEIAQLGESMRDMAVLTQQGHQTQRKKQQTLKQVRNDLLWARMLPLGDLLQRFPRMVRDMSTKHRKEVTLTSSGGATLVDKAVLEKLFDPLVHLVRNAFDHGIEMPTVRTAQGKPAQGTIEIRATHRGNQTYIEVRDDGKGIDVAAIRAKAIALQLVTPEAAASLSNERLYDFIFAPGFSTAAQVSELSGRGVGMDAVRSQIKRLKGDITLTSEPGKGTTFTLRLPLTLSIAKLLVFTIDANTLALPIDTLTSILTIPTTQIQTIQGNQFYRWQDQLIPLYPRSTFLQHYPLFKTSSAPSPAIPLPKKGKVPILLIAVGSQTIALQVDQILQEQELVIKPFGSTIAPPPYLSGCTILGDGSLVPVIDGQALIERKRQEQPHKHESELDEMLALTGFDSGGRSLDFNQPSTILVVDDSLTARQTLTFTLEKAGYRVIQAKDGREALTQLHKASVQAVFCDVEMPVMNGFEFLEQCRKEYPKSHLPVVMLTSRSGDKHRQIAELMGATGYLTKPYLEHDLLSTLQTQLDNR